MKALEQTYKIELTHDEIQTITDALDAMFEFDKVAYEDAENDKREEDSKYYYSLCSRYHGLRNSFGNLIGRSFED